MIFNRLSINPEEDIIEYFRTDDRQHPVYKAEFEAWWSDEIWPLLF